MKMSYAKPIVLANEELAEGVYAASGAEQSTDCWTVTVSRDQVDAGGYTTYRVDGRHSNQVKHISSKTTVVIEFSEPVTSAQFEGFVATVSGNTVTLVRESHANAYGSGDNFNTLLKVWPNSSSRTVLSSTITCQHETNVQGEYD